MERRFFSQRSLRSLRETFPGGAGFELLGGVVDILHDGGVTGLWSLLSLALIAEGTVRLVLLARSGRPVGSLLGLPFRSFYRWLIPPDDGWA